MFELVTFDIFSPLLEDACAIYCAVWDRDLRDSLDFFRSHANYRDHIGLLARLSGEPVGMAFGTASERSHWWHSRVAAHIGADHPALQDAWVLTELAVLPTHRGQHIGARLHDAIISRVRQPDLLLSTQSSNHHAQAFYLHRGWHFLHRGFAFQRGGVPYAIMHRPRPHRMDRG